MPVGHWRPPRREGPADLCSGNVGEVGEDAAVRREDDEGFQPPVVRAEGAGDVWLEVVAIQCGPSVEQPVRAARVFGEVDPRPTRLDHDGLVGSTSPGCDRQRRLVRRRAREDLEDVTMVFGQGSGPGLGLGLLAGEPTPPRCGAAGAVAVGAGQANPFGPALPVAGDVDDRAAAEDSGVVLGAGDVRDGLRAGGTDLVVLDQQVAAPATADGQRAVDPLRGLADERAAAVMDVRLAGDSNDVVREAGRQRQQVAGLRRQRREQPGSARRSARVGCGRCGGSEAKTKDTFRLPRPRRA